MNEIVIERLARRLLKCSFDGELFDSAFSLQSHLCDEHRARISLPHRVAGQTDIGNTERPKQLYCCPRCDFVVPETSYENPLSRIVKHIQAEHPNPNRNEPTSTSFAVSKDEELIDGYMVQRGSIERRACALEGCTTICADDDSVALHWTEEHSKIATVEEVRQTLEADPDRFRILLAEVFRELEEEEIRNRFAHRESDDGYVIHHSPSVPRVQSRPAESIIFVEYEPVRFLNLELEELLEREGWDDQVEVLPGENGAEGRQQTTIVELRFCNIVEGYIPLVRNVRRILPPLMDGETIEVSWQREPDLWFSCKVSRSKRAIYSLDGRLKRIFEPLPSGVRLHITCVNIRQYRLGVTRQPHIVPNCKVFSSDGGGGWKVDICDKSVDWETGDQVFRHQLNFQQMEALKFEALRAGLSIRDAVYEVMRRLAQGRPVHVGDVHDAVFLWMRTCSLAAVWAQFRPEHTCYVRVQPGWYRFEPSGQFPAIRVVRPPIEIEDEFRPYPVQGNSRYRVKRRGWSFNIFRSRLNDYRDDKAACLEVYCAFGTQKQVCFLIPIGFLEEHVIPHAHIYEGGRYTFNVHENDLSFVWQHGFRMEGKRFLDRSNSSRNSGNGGFFD